MLKKILFVIFIVMLFLKGTATYAQIMVQFTPALNGKDLQSLSLVRLINSSPSPIRVGVTIRIKEMNAGSVVSIKTTGFLLNAGVNSIDRIAFSNAVFSFSSTFQGRMLKQSGRFPEGEYEYCFEIEVLETKDPNMLPSYEQCFTSLIQPLSPLLLIYPVDEDELCNKRPGFIWQPPLPVMPGSLSRLVLVELKDKQDAVEAIAFNQPIINQSGIPINSLSFPANIPELKEGQSYAWQVTFYSSMTILKKSEIWTFKMKCAEQKPGPGSDSYRELKDASEGNHYIANKILRFSINNPYSAGGLSYSIVCISDPSLAVKNLPKLVLQPGLNKYDVDLSENKAFQENKEYLLKVFLPNNRELKLKFIYKGEEK